MQKENANHKGDQIRVAKDICKKLFYIIWIWPKYRKAFSEKLIMSELLFPLKDVEVAHVDPSLN
jgi:hypothetical protein